MTETTPTPTPRRGGRPWRRLVAFVLDRDTDPTRPHDGPICHICGHGGADTGDHLIALEDGGPELDPTNVKAAHGRRRTLLVDGFDCPGNYAKLHRTNPPEPRHSRAW
jgi:hypothetical protein